MGGEFIVVACENGAARDFLARKGLLMNSGGTAALIYRPLHLLGAETPVSVLCAGLLGVATGGVDVRPVADLVGRARRNLAAGTALDAGTVHTGELLQPLLVPATAVAPAAALPLYMAQGLALTRPVAAGAVLTAADVAEPRGSPLWALRREQDRRFLR